ncbi:hypothetical protein D1007_16789 [Hordeum vulgare]|nr:hypothetical protein D1007_16789 [Hordeum vulgare]
MPCSSLHCRSPDATVVAAPLRLGEPKTRPRERFITFVATPSMEYQASLLANNAVVLWLGGSRPYVHIDDIVEEIHAYT